MYVLFSECSEVGEMMFPLLSRKIRAVVKYLKKKKNPDLLIYGMLIIFRFHFPIAKHLEKYFEVIQKINVR